MPFRLVPSSLTLLLPLAIGCSAEGGADGDLLDLEVVLDENVPTVAHASWEVDGEGLSWVEYGLGGALDQATPAVSAAEGRVELSVLGLKAAHAYTVVAVTELSDGTRLESRPQTLELGTRAEGLPALDLVTEATDKAEPGGYVMMTLMQPERSWVVIVDRDGDYVWWHDAGEGLIVPTAKQARSGTDILYGSYDGEQLQDVGEIRRVSLRDGTITQTRTLLAHHDFEELPSGDFAWLGFSSGDRRLEDGQVHRVTGDVITIGPEGATEHTELDVVVDLMDGWKTPSIVCDHVFDIVTGTGGMDWTHSNSLAYVEADDAFYMYVRHHDALLKVDAATGEILWELSPESADFTGDPDDLWDHSHFSQVTDTGLVYFDNRDHQDVPVTGIGEMRIDQQGGTFERTFWYEDPGRRLMPVLGDARRLEGGNYLTAWMSSGQLIEITQGGKVAWQLESDLGSAIGRIRYLPDLYDLAD